MSNLKIKVWLLYTGKIAFSSLSYAFVRLYKIFLNYRHSIFRQWALDTLKIQDNYPVRDDVVINPVDAVQVLQK